MRRCTFPSGKEAADILISAVLLAVYYVSAVFLAEIISYKSTVLSLLFILCTAGMYGLALVSGSNGAALCKWLLSLPLRILCFEYFWRTNYAVRALNLAFRATADSLPAAPLQDF